ncbi:MAG: hypothetical protein WC326_05655 [Candidatus Delongbacteria bacterium]
MNRRSAASRLPHQARTPGGWRAWTALLLLLPLLNFVLAQPRLAADLPAAPQTISGDEACACCTGDAPAAESECCCCGPESVSGAADCADAAPPASLPRVENPALPDPDGCCEQSTTACACGSPVPVLLACLSAEPGLPQPLCLGLSVRFQPNAPPDCGPAPPEHPPQA